MAEMGAEDLAATVVAMVAAVGRMVADATVLEPQLCAMTGSPIPMLPG